MMALVVGAVTICCADPTLFQPMTNELVFAISDRLSTLDPDTRKAEEQMFGIKWEPDGLLNDPHLRSFYKPIDHMLRDPMHVLLSSGVGNVHIACLVKTLLAAGIRLGMYESWMSKFTLPFKFGKVDPNWMARKRFGKHMDILSSFASIMLCLIPIIVAYLGEVINEGSEFYEHMQCFDLLSQIVGICFLGPDDSLPYKDVLRTLIDLQDTV